MTLPLLPLLLARVPETLKRALGQTGVPWRDQHTAPRGGRFVLFDSRLAAPPAVAAGQTAIDVDPLRDEPDGGDPFVALDDERSCRAQWQLGGLAVGEVVARVDKRAVRERLLARLRTLIEAAGGTWAQLAVYPHPHTSVFSFRIDHDDYHARHFAATLDATAGHESSISHYVCAADFVGRRGELARLRGAHVGSHGFRHHTYRDPLDNLRNIARGIDALVEEGIEPIGFAAPHGRFNRGLPAALAQLGVTHSSEFGLAYDELPFTLGDVVQIPIHPICLGICLEAAADPAAAARTLLSHFRSHAEAAARSSDPILFYGHPTGRLGRFPHVLAEILDFAARLDGVWRTTLADWAAWWHARATIGLSLSGDADRYTLDAERLSSAYPAALEVWRGDRVATLPLDAPSAQFSQAALNFRPRAARRALPPPSRAGAEGWRAGLRRYLDWEHVTPIDEIDGRTWRHWAKRTLRRIRNTTQGA